MIKSLLKKISARQDILLIIFLILTIYMIIIPLPTWVIDTMIGFNFAMAFLILIVGLYLESAAAFTTLPAIILMSTLFRLSISISTTRMILLNADAGQIVETFGQFVVGGNLIVGLVIFLIITLVQFIVITKGSERVAEVGARFSLDAMPGRQMAIDADLRSGELTLEKARKLRANLQTESQFFGSMDGTMKFVKGDSIAGLVIIFVNMIGGIIIGQLHDGLSFLDALTLYTILTVGDGLVAQIPALIIAISAGSIVTRINKEDSADLGRDIVKQLSSNVVALQTTSILILIFGLIPGFPKIVFFTISLLLFSASHLLKIRNRDIEEAENENENIKKEIKHLKSPILVQIKTELFKEIDVEKFQKAANLERQIAYSSLGVRYPEFRIQENDIQSAALKLIFSGVNVLLTSIPIGCELAIDTKENISVFCTPHEMPPSLWRGKSATWVNQSDAPLLREKNIPVLTPEQAIARAISYLLPKHIQMFLGVQEARRCLDEAKADYPNLVEQAEEALPLQDISYIFQELVKENVSIHDIRSVLEAIVKWATKEKDLDSLIEYVRSHLAPQISASISDDLKTVSAYVFSPEVENVVRDSVRVTSAGSFLSLDEEYKKLLIAKIISLTETIDNHTKTPVFVSSMDVRRPLKSFLHSNHIDLPIISQQELVSDIRLHLLGEVNVN